MQFSVSGIVLTVVAAVFAIIPPLPSSKVVVFAAKNRLFAVFSLHLSAISASARNRLQGG
jgi:hypothetical protein